MRRLVSPGVLWSVFELVRRLEFYARTDGDVNRRNNENRMEKRWQQMATRSEIIAATRNQTGDHAVTLM